MKRVTAWMLALILTLGLTATASAEQVPPLEGPVGIGERPPFLARLDLSGDRSSTRFPQPLDTVTIKDGIISITSQETTIELEPPFGWVVLTQDISKQMADYAMMTDPLAVASFLINTQISFLALDANDTNLMGFFAAEGISALVGDLTEDMLEFVATYYGGEAVRIGDRQYIRLQEEELLIYLTMYQGVRVTFQLYIQGSQPTDEEIEMIEAFVSCVKYV